MFQNLYCSGIVDEELGGYALATEQSYSSVMFFCTGNGGRKSSMLNKMINRWTLWFL